LYVRSVEPPEVAPWLEASAARRPDFVQSAEETVFASAFEGDGPPEDSLALMHTDDLRIRRVDTAKWRATYFSHGVGWSLSFTDDEWDELGTIEDTRFGPAFVCVSLAEPFSPHGYAMRHYKLAAGAVLLT
jgi:hypothetical protein